MYYRPKSIHTKGEILKINLDDQVTSCIVVSDKIDQYQLTIEDLIITYLQNSWHARPKFQSDLLENNCFLTCYSEKIIFDSYILLYGDQKIWLEYGF